jgi:DNA polymerase-3 subunit gamma/tau
MALNSYKEERKNMSYTALYRKFRPDAFSDVKGQDHIVTTLKNQLRANRIGHAYLFTGTRGTGKTTVAKIFAKTVNCEHPTEDGPCGECRICKAIAAGASMNVIEIDAASNNGVDNIREIIDEVSYSPAEGKYKVYIIDEVHMLSPGAFNALLKTLEEPPSYVIFILATTEVHKIPITILSRCQRYDFKRISIDTITERDAGTGSGTEKCGTIFCGGKGHHRENSDPISEYRRGFFPFWEASSAVFFSLYSSGPVL